MDEQGRIKVYLVKSNKCDYETLIKTRHALASKNITIVEWVNEEPDLTDVDYLVIVPQAGGCTIKAETVVQNVYGRLNRFYGWLEQSVGKGIWSAIVNFNYQHPNDTTQRIWIATPQGIFAYHGRDSVRMDQNENDWNNYITITGYFSSPEMNEQVKYMLGRDDDEDDDDWGTHYDDDDDEDGNLYSGTESFDDYQGHVAKDDVTEEETSYDIIKAQFNDIICY